VRNKMEGTMVSNFGPKLPPVVDLICAAFNSDEIDELLFEVFPDLSSKIPPSGPKRKRALEIVNLASRYGKIDPLLEYVREKNPYQYWQFYSKIYTNEVLI